MEINVLDHGFIRLVDHMGSDLSVVQSARVSHDSEWRAGEDEGKDEKLIHYLMKNRHSTPFESVTFTFQVKAPIFVFRQWHRHRTQCLAGNTPLLFNRPCDGKAYRMTIGEVVRKWNPPAPKRQRQIKTLQDWNRERLGQMGLRGPSGDVQITDAWYSGQKETYRVKTKYGEVTCSTKHLFKTPGGSSRIEDSLEAVMGLVQVGELKSFSPVRFTGNEEWRTCAEGYEVSNRGRVRSYYRQGSKYLHKEPQLKSIWVNPSGRSVVSLFNKPVQVSTLVAQAFLGYVGEGLKLHKNDNPQDNRPDNLYIGTPADNVRDQYVNGGRRKLREVPVKVLSIEKKGVQDTFDISVTGEHWFVADNLVVHNSYSEVSARYTELPDEMYVPDIELIGKQSTHNKQVRTLGEMEQKERAQLERSLVLYEEHLNRAYFVYQTLLNDYHWPRELARAVLPFAIYSKMFTTINLHNTFHFLGLRLHPHAQHEIRVYAEAMLKLIEPVVPICVAAYLKNSGTTGHEKVMAENIKVNKLLETLPFN